MTDSVYANDVTVRMHLDWLVKFGHIHKTTVKLIEAQIEMIERLMELVDESYDSYLTHKECQFLDEVVDHLEECRHV